MYTFFMKSPVLKGIAYKDTFLYLSYWTKIIWFYLEYWQKNILNENISINSLAIMYFSLAPNIQQK